jgi:hypothetical protein
MPKWLLVIINGIKYISIIWVFYKIIIIHKYIYIILNEFILPIYIPFYALNYLKMCKFLLPLVLNDKSFIILYYMILFIQIIIISFSEKDSMEDFFFLKYHFCKLIKFLNY